jgi:uncharacterized OB-fold protein
MSKKDTLKPCRRCGKETFNKLATCPSCQDDIVNLKKDLKLLDELKDENFLQIYNTEHL